MEVRGVICRNWQTLSGAAVCVLPLNGQRWHWRVLLLPAGWYFVGRVAFIYTIVLVKMEALNNIDQSLWGAKQSEEKKSTS